MNIPTGRSGRDAAARTRVDTAAVWRNAAARLLERAALPGNVEAPLEVLRNVLNQSIEEAL
jgi:hypothetical protein